MKSLVKSTILIVVCFCSYSTLAQQLPTSLHSDARIQHIVYDPNNVTMIKAIFGYQTDVTFDPEEVIQTVSLGDSLAWQITPQQNHLFIKPMTASNTNMTVLTNLRSYHFQLLTVEDVKKVIPVFILRFIYPSEKSDTTLVNSNGTSSQSPTQYNWRYSYTGDAQLAPIQAFDNDHFTYFRFRKDGMRVLPAIFSVDKSRQETLVNYHIEGDYVVLHAVSKQWTLRHGKQVTSIYNDKAIHSSI